MFGDKLISAQTNCPESMDRWCTEEEFDKKATYVNIAKNRESYTAYDGGPIWSAIYKENCLMERLQGIDVSNTCTGETLLYQLVSGLHTSINMHVTTHFADVKSKDNKTFQNHDRYHSVIGTHPDRLKNLFFLYAAVLRAVNRVEPILRDYEYQTQVDPEMDKETPMIAAQLLNITITNCEEPFKEGQIFKGDNDDAFMQEMMLKEIQKKFFNISRILDCVSCEKCRLNGKL